MPIPQKDWAAAVLSPDGSSSSTNSPAAAPAVSNMPTEGVLSDMQSVASSMASVATAGLESVGDNLLSFASSLDADASPPQSDISFPSAQATMMSVGSQVPGRQQQVPSTPSGNNGLWQPTQQAQTMSAWQGVQW